MTTALRELYWEKLFVAKNARSQIRMKNRERRAVDCDLKILDRVRAKAILRAGRLRRREKMKAERFLVLPGGVLWEVRSQMQEQAEQEDTMN